MLIAGGIASESDKEHSTKSDVKVCMMCVEVHNETNTSVDEEGVK